MWPFRRETRADSSYTDALVAAITSNAAGQATAFPTATAALEAAAGFVGRAFAAAEVSAAVPMLPALSPGCLSMIGRALIRRGEIVLVIQVADGRLTLLPAASHDVDGGPDPATWRYRCTVGGPERTITYNHVPAEGVVHLSYATDPEHPWRGYGPLQVAQIAGRLSAATAAALADESGAPRGSFLPVPGDGSDPTLSSLRGDIRKAKGAMLVAESGDWDRSGSAPNTTWQARRFGAMPPAPLVELLKRSTAEVLAACGLNASLWGDGDGSAMRESYRQALHSTVAPLGKLVADELSTKLDPT